MSPPRAASRWVLHTVLAVAVLSAAPGTGAQAEPALLPWPASIARVAARLDDADEQVRQRAVFELNRLPRAAALRMLPKALGDASAAVRVTAAGIAVQLRAADSVPLVLTWLSDADDSVRLAAIRLLAVLGLQESPAEPMGTPDGDAPTPAAGGRSAAVVAALGHALADAQPDVRLEAARALGMAVVPEAFPGLLARLEDSNPRVQSEVIRSLARLGDERAVVPLIGKLQDGRSSTRAGAAEALARLHSPRAVGALLVLLGDTDREVRIAALQALGRIGGGDAVAAVAATLERERDLDVQIVAVQALGRNADPAAGRALVEALDAGRVEVRVESERALENSPADVSSSVSLCLAEGGHTASAEACARLLAKRRPERCAGEINAAWQAGNIGARVALLALGESRDPDALPIALESVADESITTRAAARGAVGALLQTRGPDGRAVEPIERALLRPQITEEELAELLGLLGRSGAERAASRLGSFVVRPRSEQVRVAALDALAALPRYAVPVELLSAALADSNPAVRWSAVRAVRAAGPGSWGASLFDAFEAAPGQDRFALALALAGPVTRGQDAALAARLVHRIRSRFEPESALLLEALARMPGAAPWLEQLAREPVLALQRKLSEVAALQPTVSRATRLTWLSSADPVVRANAAWAEGFTTGDDSTLSRLLQDPVPAVAANAVAALARRAQRTQHDARAPLCEALRRPDAGVQINALTGLRLLGGRCPDGIEQRLLWQSPVPRVRLRAAELLRAQPGTDAERERTLLDNCAWDDVDGQVATACAGLTVDYAASGTPATLFVVDPTTFSPRSRGQAGAPFALTTSGGFVRRGWADTAGSVLDVAPLARGAQLLAL